MSTNDRTRRISAAGQIEIAGERIPRVGLGTMQLPGPGALGPPVDRPEALTVLRRAVELGVRFIDTSGYYGPDVANGLIAEALSPYPTDLVIATKVGARRDGSAFVPSDTASDVRKAVEHDLAVLNVDTLHLVHARRMPYSPTPYEETIHALAELRERGLVRHIGVSNVTIEQLRIAQQVAPIVSIQNEYNQADRTSDPLVEIAEREGMAFLPFHPLALGALVRDGDGTDATPAQRALAWLLRRSPAILPIPGTRSVAHLEENLAAVELLAAEAK